MPFIDKREWDGPELFTFHHPGLINLFLQAAGINPPLYQQPELLRILCQAFARIPYENLTKIYKKAELLTADRAIRTPDEVIGDYLRWGTGGTCFSLTAAMIALLRSLDFPALPVLADRHYGINTHCAVILENAGMVNLIDPGFLIYLPQELPVTQPVRFPTLFNEIILDPVEGGKKINLYTIISGNKKYRLTYKIQPVDADTFRQAWESSFGWEMMTYPLVTCINNNEHYYLQDSLLQVRSIAGSSRKKLTPEERYNFLTARAGISSRVVQQGLRMF
ncbi:MAG: hypothetical protein JXB60_03945 [Candidatus Cloacimonetes bacterium]|nr:hypothetical protein [Candidatus Cloacimonadota bacterium]